MGYTAAGAVHRVRRAVAALRGSPPGVSESAHRKLRSRVDVLGSRTDQFADQLLEARKSQREIAALRARVEELESSVQEQRGLALRTAELADVVAQLLAAAAHEDRETFQRTVAEFADAL